jgi:hypothetical protein
MELTGSEQAYEPTARAKRRSRISPAVPGTILLQPNEFTQPDYSIVHKDPDGRALEIGRIYRDTTGTVNRAKPWFWMVEHHQRRGRAGPHQGRCDSLEEAKAAWCKCWDSADTPIHWPS